VIQGNCAASVNPLIGPSGVYTGAPFEFLESWRRCCKSPKWATMDKGLPENVGHRGQLIMERPIGRKTAKRLIRADSYETTGEAIISSAMLARAQADMLREKIASEELEMKIAEEAKRHREEVARIRAEKESLETEELRIRLAAQKAHSAADTAIRRLAVMKELVALKQAIAGM